MAQHIYNDWMEGEDDAPGGKILFREAERSVMEEITPGTMIPYLWRRLQRYFFSYRIMVSTKKYERCK